MAMPRHALPVAAIAATVLGFFLTLDRVPIAWSDGVLYASIARSLTTDNPGIPTVLAASPEAVNHGRFYGPVFFQIMALSFRVFGFSLASASIVSLLGALMIAIAGGGLVRALGGDITRQLWAVALLLVTPELGFSATNGRMDSIAVGFSMFALAVFVRGIADVRPPLGPGIVSGLLLGAAALTTPRALPFAAAFALGGGASLVLSGPERERRLRMLGITLAAAASIVCAWTFQAHGNPLAWIRYLAAIAPAVDVDVALAPAAVRDWQIQPWRVLSMLAAVAGCGTAAAGLWRARAGESTLSPAMAFALAVTTLNFAIVMLAFNLTFIFAIYFAVPLLAVVVALPFERWPVNRRALASAFVVLLTADAFIRAGKYAGAALTWSARDPARIERFVSQHVPTGSDVVGNASLYFYAVEAAGSRMLAASPYSNADWALAAPREKTRPRGATTSGAKISEQPRRRFFLWPMDESAYARPPEFACADRPIAMFEPPPTRLAWLGRFAEYTGTPGYPASTLFEMGRGCQPGVPP
jgi:4-amino-4-deoxy-L-arabinose transferase-like glycosyltransferase